MLLKTVRDIQVLITKIGSFSGTHPVHWNSKSSKYYIPKKGTKSWVLSIMLLSLISIYRVYQLVHLAGQQSTSYMTIVKLSLSLYINYNAFTLTVYLGWNSNIFAELGNDGNLWMDSVKG
jgi:hypothetical protein